MLFVIVGVYVDCYQKHLIFQCRTVWNDIRKIFVLRINSQIWHIETVLLKGEYNGIAVRLRQYYHCPVLHFFRGVGEVLIWMESNPIVYQCCLYHVLLDDYGL